MDRLQQAISKARKERGQTELSPINDKPRDPGAPKAQEPEVQDTGAETPAALPDGDAVDQAWADVTELQIPSRAVTRNRLVAHSPGELAIPYDMLRTRILHQCRKNGWRRVAIVSPDARCGKTTTVANLGFSFSRMREKRSIILDFDLRRMDLANALGQTVEHSMGQILQREVSFADHALNYGGNVLFGLNRIRNEAPSEILQSQTAFDVLDEIEATYQPDIMLFDTVPLLATDDSLGFLQKMDCALLLAAAEVTPIPRIDVAERHLAEVTNVMGIVLNRCRYAGGAHGYDGDYY